MLALLSPAKTMDMTPSPSGLKSKPLLQKQAEVGSLERGPREHLEEASGCGAPEDDERQQGPRTADRGEVFEVHVAALQGSLLIDAHCNLALVVESRRCPLRSSLAFDGPAFRGLRASMFSKAEQKQAQTSLRILCALYGVLKPYDGIRPYRLEMASKLKTSRGKTMYEFWGDQITAALAKDLKAGKIKYLVNCASQEFWKSIQPKKLPPGVRVVTCEFSGPSSLVKQARGSMCRFIVTKRIKDPAGLKKFTGDDKNRWSFQVGRSSESKLVFAPGKKRAAEDAKASSKRAKRAKRS
ncbi:unnamed protein product [Durusdinium trenchii]|uniref:Histone acetyltransferase n=1 Tax=Durusdinium trenchii TaxID=1381693 RepID=A0ABP0IRA5_9DINO